MSKNTIFTDYDLSGSRQYGNIFLSILNDFVIAAQDNGQQRLISEPKEIMNFAIYKQPCTVDEFVNFYHQISAEETITTLEIIKNYGIVLVTFIHDNYDVKIDKQTAEFIISKNDDFFQFDVKKYRGTPVSDSSDQEVIYVSKLLAMRLEVARLIIKNEYGTVNKMPDHINAQAANIIVDMLKLLPLTERYLMFYYGISQEQFTELLINSRSWHHMLSSGHVIEKKYTQFALYAIYYCWQFIQINQIELLSRAEKYVQLVYMEITNFIRLCEKLHHKFNGGNHTADNDLRQWVQSRLALRLSKEKFDREAMTIPEYVTKNRSQLQKSITRKIFSDDHYLEVCAICKSRYGSIKISDKIDSKTSTRTEQDRQTSEQDDTYYHTQKHLLEKINETKVKNNQPKLTAVMQINTSTDNKGVYRSLNDMVKFYLDAVSSNSIPSIPSQYDDMWIRDKLFDAGYNLI
jgi:hypothetical protein